MTTFQILTIIAIPTILFIIYLVLQTGKKNKSINTPLGNSLKKEYDKPTSPIRPFKRDLTYQETLFMQIHFRDHSWSAVDARGHIVLGGGECEQGMFYITEEDLENLLNQP